MIKTSKVISIQEIKEWASPNGIIYYCSVQLENKDKINIGKKKPLRLGWEVTYEILEHGQQEYQKAKTPIKVDQNIEKPYNNSSPKEIDYNKGVKIGHAITNSVNMICAGVEFDDWQNTPTTKDKIKHYSRIILSISEDLNNE